LPADDIGDDLNEVIALSNDSYKQTLASYLCA
jgi:hypothetical protein